MLLEQAPIYRQTDQVEAPPVVVEVVLQVAAVESQVARLILGSHSTTIPPVEVEEEALREEIQGHYRQEQEAQIRGGVVFVAKTSSE